MPDPQSDDGAEFVKWLNCYLGPTYQKVDSASYDRAVGIASQQSARWNQLLSVFDGTALETKPQLSTHISALRSLITAAASAKISRTPDGIFINSKVPILAEDPHQSKLDEGRRFPFMAAAVLTKRCESFLFETGHQAAEHFLEVNAAIKTALILDDFGESISQRIGIQLEKLDAGWKSVQEKANSTFDDLNNFKVRFGESIGADRKRIADLNTSALALIEEQKLADQARNTAWQEEKSKALDALRSEVREFAKIETSIDLWDQKARGHSRAYAIYGGLFSSTLIVVAASLVAGVGSEYIDKLAKLPADHQFLGIALLAIPTLAIAWLLRFLGRLTLQHFSLAHDARQRHAQISTYLRLLGDPTKPISEQERILALAALFRPIPGQAPDDISPPTTAELLKEALEGARAKS